MAETAVKPMRPASKALAWASRRRALFVLKGTNLSPRVGRHVCRPDFPAHQRHKSIRRPTTRSCAVADSGRRGAVARASIEQAVEKLARQRAARDRLVERIGNRASAPRARPGSNGIAPPLQPDLALHRLADEARNTGYLAEERGKRHEVRPYVAGRQQCGEVAVEVAGTRRRPHGFEGRRVAVSGSRREEVHLLSSRVRPPARSSRRPCPPVARARAGTGAGARSAWAPGRWRRGSGR